MMDIIPESGDGGEITGGDHDSKSGKREGELAEAKGEASSSAGHPLDVLHPDPGPILSGIRERWRLHWMHRRSAYVHLRRHDFRSSPNRISMDRI